MRTVPYEEVTQDPETGERIVNIFQVPLIVPAEVLPVQMRRAIRAAGHQAALAAVLDAGDIDLVEAWEYGLTVGHDHPAIAALAIEAGLSEEQVEDLFVAAAAL